MPTVVNATGNPDIDGVLWGWSWDHTALTYSFPTNTSSFGGYTSITNFQAFSAVEQSVVVRALNNVAGFCNLTFVAGSGATDLRWAGADSINYTDDPNVASNTGDHIPGLGGTAEANPPELAFNGKAPLSAPYAQGDNWFYPPNYTDFRLGTYAATAGIMHETGHSLGLKHGHSAQDGHGTTFPELPTDHNSNEYSVMTYHQYVGDTSSGDTAPDHPTTYMQDDIAALQYMYGANFTTNSGNTVYRWNALTGEMSINGVGQGDAPWENYVFMTVWDGGGNDTYDFSDRSRNLSINLTPGASTVFDTSADLFQRADIGDGHFARGNVYNARQFNGNAASLIENAFGGSGNDTITGNAAANYLDGGAGNDTLYGGTGNDLLYGGAGTDTLYGGTGNDFEYGGLGSNTLYGGVGDDNINNQAANVAGFVFGGDGHDFIYGSNFGDLLHGELGNDNISGGTGNDGLYGGDGTDFLYGAAGNDLLDGGLGTNFLYGGAGNDNLSGGGVAGTNFMYGGTGTNTLAGGTGTDYLFGGAGGINTMYGGSGNDFVLAQGQAGSTDLAYGGVGADYLFMGDGNDQAYGGSETDALFGGGGNDIMNGGAGQDYLWGGGGADQFQLLNSANTDVVYDWVAGDRIQVSTLMYANFAAINAGHVGYNAATNTSVIFNLDASSYVILLNTNRASLNAASFNFV
jgi:serralysin